MSNTGSTPGKALRKSEALLPAALSAALGAQSFSRVNLDISDEETRSLARLLKPDVDSWRQEFASRLRSAASDLLELTHREMQEIPPAARAYTLAVLVDKASALEGRSALTSAHVNVQINNFSSSSSKASILDALEGRSAPAFGQSAPPYAPTADRANRQHTEQPTDMQTGPQIDSPLPPHGNQYP